MFSDIENVIFKYIESIKNDNENLKLEESQIEETDNFLKGFLKNYILKNEGDMDKICEKNHSIYICNHSSLDSFTNSVYYKLSTSKILSFLDSKVYRYVYF